MAVHRRKLIIKKNTRPLPFRDFKDRVPSFCLLGGLCDNALKGILLFYGEVSRVNVSFLEIGTRAASYQLARPER